MPNPAIITCTKDTWTKVATNVATGAIYQLTVGKCFQTYRLTGDTAPTNLLEGVDLITPVDTIQASAGIDVYIYSKGADRKVRVDT
jgi:hypothetical protein